MIAAQASKNDALIDRYNINDIEKFVKEKLSDLSVTYVKSTLSQLRCLLGTVFLSGITWNYPGCSNSGISALYQSIVDSDKDGLTVGSLNASSIEPFLTWIFRLMDAYKVCTIT